MSKNLFDFTNEKIEELNTKNEQTNDFLKQKVNEYSNKSQDELMEELLNTVNNQKSNGTFNIEKLTTMVETITPYLDETQVANLKGLLEKIK